MGGDQMKSRFREGSPADLAWQEGFRAGCYFNDELLNAFDVLLIMGKEKDWNSDELEAVRKMRELIAKVKEKG